MLIYKGFWLDLNQSEAVWINTLVPPTGLEPVTNRL